MLGFNFPFFVVVVLQFYFDSLLIKHILLHADQRLKKMFDKKKKTTIKKKCPLLEIQESYCIRLPDSAFVNFSFWQN